MNRRERKKSGRNLARNLADEATRRERSNIDRISLLCRPSPSRANALRESFMTLASDESPLVKNERYKSVKSVFNVGEITPDSRFIVLATIIKTDSRGKSASASCQVRWIYRELNET